MLKPFERADWPEAATTLPQDVLENWQARIDLLKTSNLGMDHTFANWSQFLIARLLERGVPIGAGTDTPIGLGIPGYSLHTELELLVASGMSTQQALYSATVTPAEFLGLEDTMGQIKVGMAADLVLLSDNPLENIEHSRTITKVMSKGSWIE
jgi:imidazolonepropionase-like amidohydrolase